LPVAGEQFGCGDGLFDHLGVVLTVGGARARTGGQDQPVGGGDRLTVVALQPAAATQRLKPRLRIGDVGDALDGLGCNAWDCCG